MVATGRYPKIGVSHHPSPTSVVPRYWPCSTLVILRGQTCYLHCLFLSIPSIISVNPPSVQKRVVLFSSLSSSSISEKIAISTNVVVIVVMVTVRSHRDSFAHVTCTVVGGAYEEHQRTLFLFWPPQEHETQQKSVECTKPH